MTIKYNSRWQAKDTDETITIFQGYLQKNTQYYFTSSSLHKFVSEGFIREHYKEIK